MNKRRELLLTGAIVALLALAGCKGLPMKGSEFRDVAGNVQQTIRQVSGVDPAMLLVSGVWLVGIVLCFGCIAILMPNPKGKVFLLVFGVAVGALLAPVAVTIVYLLVR